MGSTQAELSRLVQAGADQVVGALRRAVDEGLEVAALTDLLAVALTQRNRIDAAVTGAIGTLDQATERAGLEPTLALSAATWLNHTLRVGASAAHAQVQLARRLPGLPETAAAFGRGELSAQHASVIARAVEQVVRGGGEAGEAEGLLLQEARWREPRDLLRWGLGLLHRVAPQEMEAEEEQRHRRRYLHLSEAFDGGYRLEGYLDPEGGALFKTALNGLLGPRRKGDERTPGERRADGAMELARRCLDSGELPARGGQRPHLTITATLETLRGDPGAPAALLDWGFPISGRALRRIAHDAEITPILVSAKGDPLHVGRRYRTATPKMRRALAERDRRCIWPGCDRPPEWTQAHHERRPWALGGRTEVDGMGLLCTVHHGRLSEGWLLERLPDHRVVVHRPVRARPAHRSPARAGP